jgi:hypothetical protein
VEVVVEPRRTKEEVVGKEEGLSILSACLLTREEASDIVYVKASDGTMVIMCGT